MDQEKYAAAQRTSYAGQSTSFTFPEGRGIVEVPLGFQPLGISIFRDTIAIADYFGPSVMLAEVSVREGVPHFDNIRWIRGTIAQGKRVRMFPDLYEPGGANRMQAVLMYSQQRLGLTRNGDHRIFMIRLRDDGEWEHELSASLPPHQSRRGSDAITSAVMTNDGLMTIELAEGGRCMIRDYRDDSVKEFPTAPHRYGIAVRGDGVVVTVADYRAEEHGLFFGNQRLTPDLTGNGIVLLNDGQGGALVTRYGHAYPGPFNGIPGALLYVPRELLGLS